MKILLICLPRTGSTSINDYFKVSNKDFITFSEPFNEKGRFGFFKYNDVIKHDNVFVKHIFTQKPKDLPTISDFELFEKFRLDFDKIVFLDRKNIKEQAESLSKAVVTGVWHANYIYSEEEGHNRNLKNETINLTYLKEEMLKIYDENKFKMFYYEDIFFDKNNMLNFLSEIHSEYNEENYKRYLDITKKYRIEKKIRGLI